MRLRKYASLCGLMTFEDRFEYLCLHGEVGASTFGSERWVNQYFYQSREWEIARQQTIFRDRGCDLGIPGMQINFGILVHHMNPVTVEDIENGEDWILDPEFLITTTHRTHNAIHYGNRNLLPSPIVARVAGDTRLW